MGSYLTPDSGSTSSLKFTGKRTKDELGVQTPTQLVDDIMNEVIDHLPAISNFRFKCVSKKWFFLNTEALKRKSQTTMSGIFYTSTDHRSNVMVEYAKLQKDQNEDSSIDGTLSFIADISKLRYMRIFDSCGGLLLRGCGDEHGFCLLFVCNPATRKWVKIPYNSNKIICVAILEFNPLVSIHFNVMIITSCDLSHLNSFEVFASETGKWKVLSQMKFYPRLFYKGLIFGIDWKHAGISGFDMEGNLCRRFDLPGLSHRSSDDFSSTDLGQSGGYLHYYYFCESKVFVWKLVDYESGCWLLKKSFQIMNPRNGALCINFIQIMMMLFLWVLWVGGIHITCRLLRWLKYAQEFSFLVVSFHILLVIWMVWAMKLKVNEVSYFVLCIMFCMLMFGQS